VPKPYPQEFRDDVVKVARGRPEGTTLEPARCGFSLLAAWQGTPRPDDLSGDR
jgi:hypothetical protein